MTSLRGIFVSESTFYEFIPLFFKFIHSIKLRATWLRTHDFGQDDFRETWPVTFSYTFFKRLSCCRLNANFMLQMLKKLNCLWFAKKWILFPSNFSLAWLAWLHSHDSLARWLAVCQDPLSDSAANCTKQETTSCLIDSAHFSWLGKLWTMWIKMEIRSEWQFMFYNS